MLYVDLVFVCLSFRVWIFRASTRSPGLVCPKFRYRRRHRRRRPGLAKGHYDRWKGEPSELHALGCGTVSAFRPDSERCGDPDHRELCACCRPCRLRTPIFSTVVLRP